MNLAKRILKALNFLVDAVVILALALTGLYSVYALWDNRQIYHAAETVQTEMRRLKPEPESKPADGDSLAQLREINPDVCAWLTLDHTNIDYPVLQGRDNLSYINSDVYGNFALAGSIFLDARNDSGFGDAYSLLYGHHMEDGKMFGDLDLYREAAFFAENSSGTLILPERVYRLEIVACLLVSASEKMIFAPQQQADAAESCATLLNFAADHSLQLRADALERCLASAATPQMLAMSTCASDFTDARTVVLAVMIPCMPEIQEEGNGVLRQGRRYGLKSRFTPSQGRGQDSFCMWQD